MYALPLAVFSMFHFTSGAAMSGMIPSWLPGGVFWVYLTGAALLAAAVSIVIQKKVALATLLLGIMLLTFVLVLHLPGVLGGGEGLKPVCRCCSKTWLWPVQPFTFQVIQHNCIGSHRKGVINHYQLNKNYSTVMFFFSHCKLNS
jgi:hypothetical protein